MQAEAQPELDTVPRKKEDMLQLPFIDRSFPQFDGLLWALPLHFPFKKLLPNFGFKRLIVKVD